MNSLLPYRASPSALQTRTVRPAARFSNASQIKRGLVGTEQPDSRLRAHFTPVGSVSSTGGAALPDLCGLGQAWRAGHSVVGQRAQRH